MYKNLQPSTIHPLKQGKQHVWLFNFVNKTWCSSRYHLDFYRKVQEKKNSCKVDIKQRGCKNVTLFNHIINIYFLREISTIITSCFYPQSWSDRIKPSNVSGQPIFSKIVQRVDIFPVSNTFKKSMKKGNNEKFCFQHFFNSFRAMQSISTVPYLVRKPHYDSRSMLLKISTINLFKRMIEKTFTIL